MAQQVMVLAVKHDDLRPTQWKERTNSSDLYTRIHVSFRTYMPIHMHSEKSGKQYLLDMTMLLYTSTQSSFGNMYKTQTQSSQEITVWSYWKLTAAGKGKSVKFFWLLVSFQRCSPCEVYIHAHTGSTK